MDELKEYYRNYYSKFFRHYWKSKYDKKYGREIELINENAKLRKHIKQLKHIIFEFKDELKILKNMLNYELTD